MSIKQKIQSKQTEIGTMIDGMKTSGVVNEYMVMRRQAFMYAIELSERDSRHLSFVPLMNDFYMAESTSDACLWFMIYRNLNEQTDASIEVLNSLQLSLKMTGENDFHIKYQGNVDYTDDEGSINEPVYAVALAGVEEDWWDIDDLVHLPKRPDAVIKATKKNDEASEMIDSMQEAFAALMDEPEEGSEGGFAGEWSE